MNLPTLNFDKESANKWFETEIIGKMTDEKNDFVDFFSKQMKIVQPDGSKVDMNEALMMKQKQFFIERMPEDNQKLGKNYDPLEGMKMPKIDFMSNLSKSKAQFEMNTNAMK